MKKAAVVILLLSLALCVFACEKVDHDQILNEISEENKIKNEKRQAFLDSDVCKAAKEYVAATLEELVPGGEFDISLEPEKLFGADLSGYADFADNPETRRDFFSKTHLNFRVNYWDFDIDPLVLADQLIDRQISGMMMADKTGPDYYDLDAVSGEAQFVQVPGV